MGEYSHANPENRMRARKLLKIVLPKAIAAAAEARSLRAESRSAAGRDVFKHIRIDNMDGIHVYPAPLGGWHADIVLKDVPIGVPSVIGTPSAMPCPTRDAAIEMAVTMVSGFVDEHPVEHLGPELGEGMVAFDYDEVVIQLPREMIEQILATIGKPPEGYAEKRLDELRTELSGEGKITKERVVALPIEEIARLHSIVALAILSGIHRWPKPVDMPPASGLPN